MIDRVEFCGTHNKLIRYPWKTIDFTPGLNVVLGDVGSGKTLLLEAIKSCKDCTVVKTAAPSPGKIFHYSTRWDIRSVESRSEAITRLKSLSHGEANSLLFQASLKALAVTPGDTLMIDEPEAGLDVAMAGEAAGAFSYLTSKGIQVILATHHPAFAPSCVYEKDDCVHWLGEEEPLKSLDIYLTEWEDLVSTVREWYDEQAEKLVDEEEEESTEDAKDPVANTADST